MSVAYQPAVEELEDQDLQARSKLKATPLQQREKAMAGLSIFFPGPLADLIVDEAGRERLEMRLRAELASALHVHASRVLLLAIKTRSYASEDNMLCINIAPHRHDVRSREALAATLAPALGLRV